MRRATRSTRGAFKRSSGRYHDRVFTLRHVIEIAPTTRALLNCHHINRPDTAHSARDRPVRYKSQSLTYWSYRAMSGWYMPWIVPLGVSVSPNGPRIFSMGENGPGRVDRCPRIAPGSLETSGTKVTKNAPTVSGNDRIG